MSSADDRATWKALAERQRSGSWARDEAVPALLADVERLERELARHRQCGLMPAEADL